MSLLNTALFADPELDALLDDGAHLAAIVRFESLLASASAAEGLVPTTAAEEIEQHLKQFSPDPAALGTGLARDGVVVPTLVATVREGLSVANRKWLHFGATSQDAIDTAWALQLAQIVPVLQLRLGHLSSTLDGLVVQFGGQKLMAHTRMQAALPFTLTDKLVVWLRTIEECSSGLVFAAERALAVQLGGPVGNRASFEGKGDAIAARLAHLSGLRDAPAWHSNRVALCRLGAELAAISGVLGKLGADIALMTQSEVGQAAIRGGGGSSTMAHKNNPVEAELLVTLARHSAGNLGTLYQALVHENERSGAAWTLEWLTLPTIVRNAGCGLLLAQSLLGRLSFPPQDIA
ncbi:MAG: 3-carboxy-cis,cis-muconate cycloisomerase [Devosia sp.]